MDRNINDSFLDKVKKEEKEEKLLEKEYDKDNSEDNKCANKNDIQLSILENCASSRNDIYERMQKEEDDKSKQRLKFIKFFKNLLVISLIFIGTLISLDGFGIIELATEMVIALFAYVIANIFSILFIMLKYVTKNNYLETFKVVTHKLLDYIVMDKESRDSGNIN